MKLPPLLVPLACAQALAQAPLFLTPELAHTPLGQPVTLRVVATDGPDAEPTDWPDQRTAHFFARTAWTQENRDALPPLEGVETAASWTADRPGVLLLGLDLDPEIETIDSAAFAAFVASSLNRPERSPLRSPPAGGDVRVLRIDSAKTIVTVAHDGPPPDPIATSKTGQQVEIRPLMEPSALTPGSDLALKLYARVEGAASGMVIATNTTTGQTLRSIADDSAIANVHVPSAGRWRVRFHALAPHDAPEADYELHTATLTFDVREVNR